MEKRILTLALAALALTAQSVRAEGDDFGLWTEVGAEKKLSRRVTADGGIELRTRDNTSEVDRWSGGLGLTYKLTPWLKASAGYTLLYDNNERWNTKGTKVARYWGERHRVNVSLTGAVSFGNVRQFTLSLRERWQYTYRPEKTADRERVSDGAVEEHLYSGKGKHLWRNRLQLKYKLSKAWRPYVSGETCVGGSGLDKLRLAAGTELRLSKRHWVDMKYIFQKAYDDDDDEGNRHVIAIGYTYKF